MKKYIPTQLMSSYSLLPQAADVSDFMCAVVITGVLSVVNLLLSILILIKSFYETTGSSRKKETRNVLLISCINVLYVMLLVLAFIRAMALARDALDI